MDLKDQRVDYDKFLLTEDMAGNDPYDLFQRWFRDASETEVEPNIMTISTVLDGKPRTRVVLLKEVFEKEFVFYTNYNSIKGQAMEQNPNVSLLFFWGATQRQVRIDGTAQKVSDAQSEEYFHSRPIESQIGAIASAQSHELANRQELEQRVAELTEYYRNNPIERPKHWGGYTIKPETFEFWQGRASRLHDRIVYDRTSDGWKRSRLQP
jgi:pyridoxamine-phosphate oxidase